MEAEAVVAMVASTGKTEKCTMQPAQTVVRKHRYLSHLTPTDQYTVGTAYQLTGHQRDTNYLIISIR